MIELLTAKTRTGHAIARRVTAAQTLCAPHVLDGEVISALLGLMRGQKISEREADAALSNYCALCPRTPRSTSPLAEALRVPLITADARIKRSGIARCEVEVFDAHT